MATTSPSCWPRSTSETDRRATFRTVVLCSFPDGAEIVAEGAVEGEIVPAPRGDRGLRLRPGLRAGRRRRAYLCGDDPAEKHALSHRGLALRSLAARLKEEL